MKCAATLLALVILACGGEREVSSVPPGATPAGESQAGGTPAGQSSPASLASAVIDDNPEPSDAQARAEAVLDADFNRNKRTTLVMNITTLVDRTSSLQGFGSALASREEKIEDRLARLQAKVTETEVTIQLPGSILFDFDSAKIRPDAERTLTDVQQVIKSYAGRPVRVDGHTDSISSDSYNQKLSEQRAKSVTTWFTSHGVEGSRLQANGLGETKPVATNETSEGRQLNRRVEIVIAKK